MHDRDPHKALRSKVLASNSSQNCNFTLVELQWGKDDFGYSLHTNPRSFSTYGYQVTDFLNQLGFQRSACSFGSGQCYVRWVERDFDLVKFVQLFDSAFRKLTDAQRNLEKCGFFFDQPEGWGYFTGRQTRSRLHESGYYGDGHTATEAQQMEESEDDVFRFKFTWIKDSESDKGWVIHYRAKHGSLSAELHSVFVFLKIQSFEQCPEFDFEPCSWRFIEYKSRGDRSLGDNADTAHSWFGAHKEYFSSGIQMLLEANANVEKAGLVFLPFEKSEARLSVDITKRVSSPRDKKTAGNNDGFDVAISFAGTERQYAEELAQILQNAGYVVFYDNFYPEDLWGKDLVSTFDRIYRKQSRYCVMFISKEYKNRVWTIQERRSAFARNLQEGGEDYILPIKVDDTDIDGLPPTIGYMHINKGIAHIAETLIKKIQKVREHRSF